MLSTNLIFKRSNKCQVILREDLEQDEIHQDIIQRVDEDKSEDNSEFNNLLSYFSENKSNQDDSKEEIINILRRSNRSNPEMYNSKIIKPKFKRFIIPERVSNPFHKNPFSQRLESS